MLVTTIAPMVAAINLNATNQLSVNTLIAGQAALMANQAAQRRMQRTEANNVVDMETTESSPKPFVDSGSYYRTS